MKKLFIIGCISLLLSCTADELLIQEGDHHSSPDINILWVLEEDKEIVFDITIPEMWVQTESDWNKGVGISNGLVPNKDMVNIAFRCWDGELQYAPYFNKRYQKILPTEWISHAYPGNKITGRMSIIQDSAHITFTDGFNSISKGQWIPKSSWGYLIQPWYGGQAKAPQDITVFLNVKKIK